MRMVSALYYFILKKIKRLINGNKDISNRNKILFLVQKNCLEIVQNPFGNYIIQHILEEWGPEVCKDVTIIIHQNLISLSMQKFSSNVVEKCMDLISEVYYFFNRTLKVSGLKIFSTSPKFQVFSKINMETLFCKRPL